MSMKSDIFSGSWINQMFLAPPARQVKGRTRWTHRHGSWIKHLNRFAFVESRNEQVSLLSLEYLWNNSLIRRFKEQPFTLPATDLGFEYTPDFAFEDIGGTLYVVEVKTQRFVTRAMEEKFEKIKEFFLKYQIHFLLWTDKAPLTSNLRHNILNMRRFSFESFPRAEEENLLNIVKTKQEVLLSELYESDIDLGLIYASLYNGNAHIDIRQKITVCSLITSKPTTSPISIYTAACATVDSWWNSLEAA